MKNPLSLLLSILLGTSGMAHAVPGQPLTDFVRQVDSLNTAKLAPHPRLLLTPPEQARVRAATKTPEGRPYWEAVRAWVEKYRKDAPLPDPPGYPDGKWTVEEWRRIVNAGGDLQNRMMAAAFVWVVTQDPGDLAEAKRWALNATEWNPNGASGIEGVDHAAHDVLHGLCLAYDWLYAEWTPEERAKLEACIAARGRALYGHLHPYRYDSWNNHAWFQTTALAEAGLALADKLPEADTWWRYASNLYFSEYLPLGGRDGDWHEGTHYASYTFIFVYQWADALKTATGIDAYAVPWLRSIGYFRLFTAPPTGGGIHFNDNNVRPPDQWDKMTAYAAARSSRDPVLQWYAETMNRSTNLQPVAALMCLVYRDARIVPQPPGPDTPRGRWFRDSGWVVFRTGLDTSDDVQFGLKAGPFLAAPGSRGHDHPDQGSFLINYLAEPLVVDSGYYDWYGSPHHNGWTFTARAHNTLVVNGAAQSVATQGADGKVVSFVSANDGLSFVEAELAAAYPKDTLDSWRRQVVFAPPDTFVIRDVVRTKKPAEVEWLLHGPNEFGIEGQGFAVTNRRAGMAGRLLLPSGLTLSQWGGFPEGAAPERKKPGDYPDQWHLTALSAKPETAKEFVAVLRTGKAGVKLPPADAAEANGSRVVYVSGDRPLTVNAFEAAPSKVALTASQGPERDRRVLLVRAMRVAGERVLWVSHQPADVSGRVTDAGWVSLTVRLNAPSRVRFAANAKPSAVLVAGRAAPFAWDKATRTAALDLPEGESRLRIDYRPSP